MSWLGACIVIVCGVVGFYIGGALDRWLGL